MNQNTVFYAWQSDLPEKCNHYFVRDAAQAAINALKSELAVDEAPRLDHDTKGVSGTPDIAQTIFDKIGDCSVFLADVSLVGSTMPRDAGAKAKSIPNPNVMIELGYALRAVSHERIVLVMNTAFGAPEELPFDLRARRHPIQYHLPTPSDPSRKAISEALTEKLKVAIRAILESTAGLAAAEEAAAQVAARARVAEARTQFEELALRGQFHGFQPTRGALLLTLVPERPLAPPLSFSEPKLQALHLGTISNSPVRPELHGRKLVVIDGKSGDMPPTAATELREDGVILASDGYLLSQAATEQYVKLAKAPVSGLVPSIAYEEVLALAVAGYLQLMRHVGVRGPIAVALSLFRVQGFMMAVDVRDMLMRGGGRQYQGNGITPDPVIFLENANTTSALRLLLVTFDRSSILCGESLAGHRR